MAQSPEEVFSPSTLMFICNLGIDSLNYMSYTFKELMDFCTLKMYMVNTKKDVSVLSTGAGNSNPKNVSGIHFHISRSDHFSGCL